ncbi:MAG: SDR family NAD(P)-dependent oxidoreductase [Bacteroidetes bacterium]|nr:SDR family NAD(P)-dependent oxidoreductase [Bacteroidota bacterium]
MSKEKERYSNAFSATLSGIADLFRKQKNVVTLKEEDLLTGKNVLITGASSGLGFEASVQLAKRGAKVWMACRSGIPEKGKMVQNLSGSNQVEMLPVDLSDIDSIVKLVNTLKESSVKLDVVICNAAVVPLKSRKTKQGFEEMFMVNYLATYLFVRLLIENDLIHLDGTTIPRIIFVSSESHRNPKEFDWNAFGKYQEYSAGQSVERYGYNKLLLTTFANELSNRLNPSDKIRCSVFALCPGPVNTNIAREAPAIFKPLLKLIFKIFFRSPKVAVQPLVYFACSPEVNGTTNRYLFLMSEKQVDIKASNRENGKRLWNLSEELLQQHGFAFQK